IRAENAVYPTSSENITVTRRRSADADAASVAASGLLTLFSCWFNFAIALRMRRRWPALDTPISFSNWSSICPSRSKSRSLVSKASAYWARPIESSHLRTSLMLRVALKALCLLSYRSCLSLLRTSRRLALKDYARRLAGLVRPTTAQGSSRRAIQKLLLFGFAQYRPPPRWPFRPLRVYLGQTRR